MPLEPHDNVDFKTGAGIDDWTKNVWLMTKKLNLIWNKNRWVFWAQNVISKIKGIWKSSISDSILDFSGLFNLKNAILGTFYDIPYISSL